MALRHRIFFFFIGICIATSAYPQRSRERHFIEMFFGNCAQNMPDTIRIEAASRVFGWKPLEGDLAAMFAPANPKVFWKGWSAVDRDELYLIAITEDHTLEEDTYSCTVAGRDLSPSAVIELLKSELHATLTSDEVDTMQRYVGLHVKVNDLPMLLNMTTEAHADVSSMISLTILSH